MRLARTAPLVERDGNVPGRATIETDACAVYTPRSRRGKTMVTTTRDRARGRESMVEAIARAPVAMFDDDGVDGDGASAFETSMMTAGTEFDASVCAASPVVASRAVAVRRADGDDDDYDVDDDEHNDSNATTVSEHAERRLTNALALTLTLERDAAESRARALEAFAREEMHSCDARCRALSTDVDDLLAALGAASSADARRRWRFAIRAVCERAKRIRDERRVASLIDSRFRLERQLRRVQRYVTVAADDFERLNARLAREARDARDAREDARLAKEALAAASRAPRAETVPDVRVQPTTAVTSARDAAAARRADAKAKCASVADTMARVLADWRVRDPAVADRLARAASAR